MSLIKVVFLRQNFLLQKIFEFNVSEEYYERLSFGSIIQTRLNNVLRIGVVISKVYDQSETTVPVKSIRNLSLNTEYIRYIYKSHPITLNQIFERCISKKMSEAVIRKTELKVSINPNSNFEKTSKKQQEILNYLDEKQELITILRKEFGTNVVRTMIQNNYITTLEVPKSYQAQLLQYYPKEKEIKKNTVLLRNDILITNVQLLDLNVKHKKILVILPEQICYQIKYRGIYEFSKDISTDKLNYNLSQIENLEKFCAVSTLDYLPLVNHSFDLVIFLDDYLLSSHQTYDLKLIYDYFLNDSLVLVMSKLLAFETYDLIKLGKFKLNDRQKKIERVEFNRLEGDLLDLKLINELGKNDQTLFLINDKEFAKKISCKNCHTIYTCNTCNFNLYANNKKQLQCRYCKKKTVPICKVCKSHEVSYELFGGEYLKTLIQNQQVDFEYINKKKYLAVYIFELPTTLHNKSKIRTIKHLLAKFSTNPTIYINSRIDVEFKDLLMVNGIDFYEEFLKYAKFFKKYPYQKTCYIDVLGSSTFDVVEKTTRVSNFLADLNPTLKTITLKKIGIKQRRRLEIIYETNIVLKLKNLIKYSQKNNIEIKIYPNVDR